ncbi:ribbon-helix-helix protein, CopG family [Halostella pelagica]|uniref:ribbon-helix-helix protein, CopG family n=1 Tax=Halostella pelagica TaxID=2583824 RepID=UPI0010814B28|nr:ribbon-helix-helix protein, CopG family [Halostella pelagica]
MTRDKQLSTSVDAETKRDFRVAAAKRDMDMAELLRELVNDYLEEGDESEGNRKAEPMAAD